MEDEYSWGNCRPLQQRVRPTECIEFSKCILNLLGKGTVSREGIGTRFFHNGFQFSCTFRRKRIRSLVYDIVSPSSIGKSRREQQEGTARGNSKREQHKNEFLGRVFAWR
jgi:hypothetical protein